MISITVDFPIISGSFIEIYRILFIENNCSLVFYDIFLLEIFCNSYNVLVPEAQAVIFAAIAAFVQGLIFDLSYFHYKVLHNDALKAL